MSDVLFQGYERGTPWCCFMVHSDGETPDDINRHVRVYLTEYITARRKAQVDKLCIGDFITYLRREKNMEVNQNFNIRPERIDV
jgi:hypothetical protein